MTVRASSQPEPSADRRSHADAPTTSAPTTPPCEWCGRAIYQGTYLGEPVWLAVKGEERGYCPGCGVAVDDRDPRWGGGVYQLDRDGRIKP